MTPATRQLVTTRGREQKPGTTAEVSLQARRRLVVSVLLLDGCESGPGADRVPGDASPRPQPGVSSALGAQATATRREAVALKRLAVASHLARTAAEPISGRRILLAGEEITSEQTDPIACGATSAACSGPSTGSLT